VPQYADSTGVNICFFFMHSTFFKHNNIANALEGLSLLTRPKYSMQQIHKPSLSEANALTSKT